MAPCLNIAIVEPVASEDGCAGVLEAVFVDWGVCVNRIISGSGTVLPADPKPDVVLVVGKAADDLLNGRTGTAAPLLPAGIHSPVMLVASDMLEGLDRSSGTDSRQGLPLPKSLKPLHSLLFGTGLPSVASDCIPCGRERRIDVIGSFIGTSPAMRRVYSEIFAAAPSTASVFVTGESGTGKELCVEAIHAHSPRAQGPLVSINCSAIPKDLIESEIFGHERGAFTGATERHDGAAIRAHGGTLFLDEICEMDLALQSKLLRFLQSGRVQRVGSTRPKKVDVRIICATNRDPLEEVDAGRLREDLYYRLHVIPIALPPLRDRGHDVLQLAQSFLHRFAAQEKKRFTGFDAGVERILMTYSWPGNVRQLENLVQNIVVMNSSGLVVPEMLPLAMAEAGQAHSARSLSTAANGAQRPNRPIDHLPPKSEAVQPLWLQERQSIERAITACNGNLTRAAALLEINPSTLYRKRRSWASDAA